MDETTVAAACEAVSLDNFIHVVGLLINTSDMVGENEVMVCNGIDHSFVNKGVNFLLNKSWRVHASYTSASPSQALGDVFVFDKDDNSVVAVFTGCRFAKSTSLRLERLLDPVNRPLEVPCRASPIPNPGIDRPEFLSHPSTHSRHKRAIQPEW